MRGSNIQLKLPFSHSRLVVTLVCREYDFYDFKYVSSWESGTTKIGRNNLPQFKRKIINQIKRELRKRKYRLTYCR